MAFRVLDKDCYFVAEQSWCYHDHSVSKFPDAVLKSAASNGLGEPVWCERDRVSAKTNGPYIERKIGIANAQGVVTRLCKVNDKGEVRWTSPFVDDNWRVASREAMDKLVAEGAALTAKKAAEENQGTMQQ